LFLVLASQKSVPIQEQQFGRAVGLLSGVSKILDEISVQTLEDVSREWINRLNQCIAANREYVE
jgi:hypothetical protein